MKFKCPICGNECDSSEEKAWHDNVYEITCEKCNYIMEFDHGFGVEDAARQIQEALGKEVEA